MKKFYILLNKLGELIYSGMNGSHFNNKFIFKIWSSGLKYLLFVTNLRLMDALSGQMILFRLSDQKRWWSATWWETFLTWIYLITELYAFGGSIFFSFYIIVCSLSLYVAYISIPYHAGPIILHITQSSKKYYPHMLPNIIISIKDTDKYMLLN